ncbi:ferredoxin--NADP reductase, root isozyme, chloroplastic-like [Dioscorea cayenensis subsp. rotundata]|uniref:ferredoxin--NADP(+) reductase n=1 Tax=Dioscorea cayennensis subsp. rotundata TaxID=55577 RepID=A0AB40C9A3_DIOCR|nr:ferredoxin--NADP reductase, root isozyme, chloroplastic-like [Dioscorea cayenensis subsp. rotundata]
MALKADLCSVMHAKMLPGKCLRFNHSGSRIFSNLSFRNKAPTSLPCFSLRNEKQHSKYNHKVLGMSARGATKLNAAVIPLEAGETREIPSSTYKTTVVSVETLVGPKGGLGEICHIVLDHGGSFSFVEGQYLEVHFQLIKRYFSIASCRDGDVFDGKTLSLCVRRGELFADNVSNYLCNVKAGDVVEISGPLGKRMVFPEPQEGKHIMVATATGIAPFRSNTQRLFLDPHVPPKHKFQGLAWLIDGADNYNSLLYNKEFTNILENNPDHFMYQRALNNNSVADLIYENGDEIFTLLDGGAYIYFAGSHTMMPGIRETFQKIADERGVDWPKKLTELIKNQHWRVEVY